MIALRAAVSEDAAAIAAIYAPHVLAGTVSFETEAPDGTDVIDRVPTNLGDRALGSAEFRTSDRCSDAETRLSRVDRGASAACAVVHAVEILSFVACSCGGKT